MQKSIYNMIRRYRLRKASGLVGRDCMTVLDIGAADFMLAKLLGRRKVTSADASPKTKGIRREDAESLSFKDRSFDAVVALEVLEHTRNPVAAIREIARVAAREIIVSVPNEPFFTLARLCHWEKEHLWAVTPLALKTHLGRPAYEEKFFCRRYYIAKWLLPVKAK